MSFGMLMSNFRRKKIIDTLKNKGITYEEKQEILQPYGKYIGQFVDNTNPREEAEKEYQSKY